MINNTPKIERMGFISKYVTNFPETTPPKTATQNSYVKAMISIDYRGFGFWALV
jgi:hypothetical protein|tara:strand:- start:510 stop:671 length:162 start_codon:yes stop_codon:yes gene_type:complete